MKKALIIILTIACTGCAVITVLHTRKKIAERIDPLMGETKKEVVLAIGAPETCEFIDEIEVCRWRRSYGQRGGAYAAGRPGAAAASGSSWESYDEINIYFIDGKAVKWDGYVQR